MSRTRERVFPQQYHRTKNEMIAPEDSHIQMLREKAMKSYTLNLRMTSRVGQASMEQSSPIWKMPVQLQTPLQTTIKSEVMTTQRDIRNSHSRFGISNHSLDMDDYMRHMSRFGRTKDQQMRGDLDHLTIKDLKQHYERRCKQKIGQIDKANGQNQQLDKLRQIVNQKIEENTRNLAIFLEKYINRIMNYESDSNNLAELMQLIPNDKDLSEINQAKNNLQYLLNLLIDTCKKIKPQSNKNYKLSLKTVINSQNQTRKSLMDFELKSNAIYYGPFSGASIRREFIVNLKNGKVDSYLESEYIALLIKCFKPVHSRISILTSSEMKTIKACHLQNIYQNFRTKYNADPFFDFDHTAVIVGQDSSKEADKSIIIVSKKNNQNRYTFKFWKLFLERGGNSSINVKNLFADFFNFIAKKKDKLTKITFEEQITANSIYVGFEQVSTDAAILAALTLFTSKNQQFMNNSLFPLDQRKINSLRLKLEDLFKYLAFCAQEGREGRILDKDFIRSCTVDALE